MITVIGLDGSPLSEPAAKALAGATLVIGGRRHLTAVPVAAGARTEALGELRPALDALAAHQRDARLGDAVVLASGDPGFFGIVRALAERDLRCTVLPGVSSVSRAFARAGLPWDDAIVVSAHGRALGPAANVCRAFPKVAVLTGPAAGPAEIGAALAGWRRRLIVCERLGDDGERVTACSPAQATGRDWAEPNVVLVLSGDPGYDPARQRAGWAWPWAAAGRSAAEGSAAGGPAAGGAVPGGPAAGGGSPAGTGRTQAGWALPDDSFDSRDAVITKSEVRALALARLGPAPGMLVWDVGAGSGSVAVECARLGAAVVAVERDRRRCDLVRANAARHGADVRVVTGEAPAVLNGLPAPDVVFVGGGGPAVVTAVAARHPARIVVALAAVERVGPARAALAAAGYAVDAGLVQAARLAPLPGEVHRLAATNPVFLLSGTEAPR